jgi:glutamine synthetase type III
MAKAYEATCKVHGEGCTLKSRVGEDLQEFKDRMKKDGHEVGELKNADYKLTERGYKLLSEAYDKYEALSKVMDSLRSEFDKIEGMVDIKQIPEFSPGSTIEGQKPDAGEGS